MANDPENPGLDFDPEPHKKRLVPGAILLARESLQDPNFDSTVLLLCQYSSEGAYGLVLNRASHMPLKELFEHPPETPDAAENRCVYVGGPVQPFEMQTLQIAVENPVPGSHQIIPGVNLGGAWEELDDILAQNPKFLRLFLGYSGWGAGQLEKEVDQGVWEVYQVDVLKLLLGPEEPWFGGSEQFKMFLETL